MRRLVLLVGIAVVVLGVGAAAKPTSSQAFIGEPLVVNPVTKALTPAAEKVVKAPGYIPEVISKARAFGGSAEANAAAGVFQKGKVIPLLGSWLAFDAGMGIGKEICNMFGLGWCMSQTATEPAPSAQLSWEFMEDVCGGPKFAWRWGKVCNGVFLNYGGNRESCGDPGPPGGAGTFVVVHTGEKCWLGPDAGQYEYSRGYIYRLGVEGRGFGWGLSDDPEVPNYSYSQPSNWPTKTGEALLESPEAERVGEDIASQIEGSEVASPYELTVEVPDCDGLVYASCEELLEELGLTPQRVERNWETADTDKDADEVLELEPARATEVEKGSVVKVITNPPKEGMPIVIPPIQPGETYDDYAARLNPILKPERVQLPDYATDPKAGPDAAVRVAPQPGSRVPPDTPTTVRVWTNPPTAPPPGGGGDCDASVGEIDFGPLNKPLGDKFPFGVVSFFAGWIGEWGFSSEPPEWSVTFLPAGAFGSEEGVSADVDFGALAPVFDVVRVAFMFASFVGLLWFLGTAAMKLQGDDS